MYWLIYQFFLCLRCSNKKFCHVSEVSIALEKQTKKVLEKCVYTIKEHKELSSLLPYTCHLQHLNLLPLSIAIRSRLSARILIVTNGVWKVYIIRWQPRDICFVHLKMLKRSVRSELQMPYSDCFIYSDIDLCGGERFTM